MVSNIAETITILIESIHRQLKAYQIIIILTHNPHQFSLTIITKQQ